MSWKTFLHAAPASDHAVQVYEDLAELCDSVGRYLDAGFHRGEPALLIATPDHLDAFVAEVEARGWHRAQLEAQGLLTVLDAQRALEGFMNGDVPSKKRFHATVGTTIDEGARRFPDKTIRAFGEMVDLLWQTGNEVGAIALEELWNQLAETRRFSLLCGYHLDIFDLNVQTSALPEIVRVHNLPRPVADTSRLAAAVDEALTEVMGRAEAGQIYLRVGEQVPRTELPRAHAILAWLSDQDTENAQRVLDRVRAHYIRLGNTAQAQPHSRA
jgi:hypothetical protein